MSALRIAVATGLAVAAVVAALLAADLRSWRSGVAQGDAVYVVTPKQAAWTPSTTLGGAGRALLGIGPDLEQRHALQLYLTARSIPDRLDTATELQSVRAEAETALGALTRGRHASQADTLLGILAFDAAATGPGASGADAAIADFTDAVRADPDDAAAKFDLELLLRLTAAQGSRPGAGAGGSIGKGGRRGAGGGVPGNGY